MKETAISVKNNLYTATLQGTVDYRIRILSYFLSRQYEIPMSRESKDRSRMTENGYYG